LQQGLVKNKKWFNAFAPIFEPNGINTQALGLSENFAVFGAGFYQTFFQPTNDWSNWRGFFDHAQDTKMIKAGYNHFK